MEILYEGLNGTENYVSATLELNEFLKLGFIFSISSI